MTEIDLRINLGALLLTLGLFRFGFELVNSVSYKPQGSGKKEIRSLEAGGGIMLVLSTHILTPVWCFFPFTLGKLEILEAFSAYGLYVAAFGGILFVWSHLSLGKNHSGYVEALENHQLVTSGIYKYVRHPMYLSGFFIVLGIFLVTGNILIWLLGTMGCSMLYLSRVEREEALMLDLFGDEFIEYSKKSGRLIPKLF